MITYCLASARNFIDFAAFFFDHFAFNSIEMVKIEIKMTMKNLKFNKIM